MALIHGKFLLLCLAMCDIYAVDPVTQLPMETCPFHGIDPQPDGSASQSEVELPDIAPVVVHTVTSNTVKEIDTIDAVEIFNDYKVLYLLSDFNMKVTKTEDGGSYWSGTPTKQYVIVKGEPIEMKMPEKSHITFGKTRGIHDELVEEVEAYTKRFKDTNVFLIATWQMNCGCLPHSKYGGSGRYFMIDLKMTSSIDILEFRKLDLWAPAEFFGVHTALTTIVDKATVSSKRIAGQMEMMKGDRSKAQKWSAIANRPKIETLILRSTYTTPSSP